MPHPNTFHIHIAAVNQADSLSSALALQQGMEDYLKRQKRDDMRVSVNELLRTIAENDAAVDKFYRQELALIDREAKNPHALEQRMRQAISGVMVRMYRQKLQPFTAQLADYFAQQPANLIISTHPWLGLALHQARQQHSLAIPVLDFVSEPFSATPLWANPQARHFVMSSKKCRADLLRMGIPEKRLAVQGYPLGRAKERDQRKTRDRLDLRDRFTITLALHEHLSVPAGQDLIEAILAHPSEPFLIVINNVHEEMFEWLNQFYHSRLRVRNVMHDHYHHVAAADVLVAPADSSLLFTAASLGRPAIISHYASLAQKRLVDWLEEKQLGRYRGNIRKILQAINYYHDESRCDYVKGIGTRIAFQKRSERLVEYLIRYAEKSQRPSLD